MVLSLGQTLKGCQWNCSLARQEILRLKKIPLGYRTGNEADSRSLCTMGHGFELGGDRKIKIDRQASSEQICHKISIALFTNNVKRWSHFVYAILVLFQFSHLLLAWTLSFFLFFWLLLLNQPWLILSVLPWSALKIGPIEGHKICSEKSSKWLMPIIYYFQHLLGTFL